MRKVQHVVGTGKVMARNPERQIAYALVKARIRQEERKFVEAGHSKSSMGNMPAKQVLKIIGKS